MQYKADFYIEKLFDHFQVSSISELADKLGVSQPAISQWKKKNYVKAIASKCRELGIYNEIFGDENTEEEKEITTSSFNEDIQRLLDIAIATISDNKEKENDFKDNLKSWISKNI